MKNWQDMNPSQEEFYMFLRFPVVPNSRDEITKQQEEKQQN